MLKKDGKKFMASNEIDQKKLIYYDILHSEANAIREQDKLVVRSLFHNFSQKELTVGIGFQRAYGSILSGDYFDSIKLPDGQLMFVFADISGHGLPAYTTLIRLRAAITLAVKEVKKNEDVEIDPKSIVKDISVKFTDIMDESNSDDFACIIFVFIAADGEKYNLRIFNRSMLFPFALKRRSGKELEIVNLNYAYEGWEPERGVVLGNNFYYLLAKEYYELPECSYSINKGDSLFFYSDGISEAHNKDDSEEFGEKRIESVLMYHEGLFPQVIVEELFREVYTFIGGADKQIDDMTAVLIEFPDTDLK